MEGGAQNQSVDEQVQISAAFRKLYQAISEVSQTVASLPIGDEEMHQLMAKMDQLNDAFSALRRRVHSQPGSSVSSVPPSPYTEKIEPCKGNIVSLSLEEKLEAISIETKQTKQALEKMKTEHKSDIRRLGGMVAVLTKNQNDILERLANSEEKVKSLVHLQALLNNLHMNVEERAALKCQVEQVNGDLEETRKALEKIQAIFLEHVADCSESESAKPNLIAFHAWADTAMKSYIIGETIEFTNVLLNASNCYDVTTSTFTAPMDGLYFFSSSINLSSKFLFTAVITNNDKESLALFGAPAIEDLQTSTSTLAALTKGDQVKVNVYGLNAPEGARPGGGFSSFLGFFIR